jgi:hypothetical protein
MGTTAAATLSACDSATDVLQWCRSVSGGVMVMAVVMVVVVKVTVVAVMVSLVMVVVVLW